jgi:hypothetical protein
VDATDAARVARQNKEREKQLQEVPLQEIDLSKWPEGV